MLPPHISNTTMPIAHIFFIFFSLSPPKERYATSALRHSIRTSAGTAYKTTENVRIFRTKSKDLYSGITITLKMPLWYLRLSSSLELMLFGNS